MKILILSFVITTLTTATMVRADDFSSVESRIDEIDARDADAEAVDAVASTPIEGETPIVAKKSSSKRTEEVMSQIDSALDNVSDNPEFGEAGSDVNDEINNEIGELHLQNVQKNKARANTVRRNKAISKKAKTLKSSKLVQKNKTRKPAKAVSRPPAPKPKQSSRVTQKRQIASLGLPTTLPKKKVR
jgi:hypothetical protein